MQFIQRHKINSLLFIVVMIVSATNLFAQANQEQYDNKTLHFGFTLSANIPSMRVDTRLPIMRKDSVQLISTSGFVGIGLGGITNLRLSEHWDLRLLFPVISFVQRNITYTMHDKFEDIKIESAYADASLLIKFKSQRRKNVRAYLIGGLRMSYDLSSSITKNRSDESPVVSLVPYTAGYEFGMGLDIYFPYFKFSPEIKVMNTFGNAVYYDGFIYTDVIEKISPKMVVISLHFE